MPGGVADISVAVYEEDTMRMAASGKAPVGVTGAVSTVTVDIVGDMPDYFIATAYMIDRESHGPLCDSYTTDLYSEAMQRIEGATLDDFADDQTVNLDDSRKTNFVVYSGTTKVIPYREGRDHVTEDGDGTYTVTEASEDFTSLKEGDIFSYSHEDGTLLIVKVADISVSGDTVRITEEEDLDLESVFDVIKVEGGVKTAPGTEPAQAGRKKAEYSAEKSVTKSIDVNKSGEALGGSASGTLTLSGSLKISGYVKAYTGWGGNHIEAKASLLLTGDFSLDGTLETEVKLLKDAPEIKICAGVKMKVTPVLAVKFNGKLETGLKVTAAVGAACTSKGGSQNLSEDPKVELDIKVEGTLYVGLRPEVTVVVLNDGFATAKVSAEAGAALEMAYQKELTNSTEAESRHICDLCIAGTLDLSIRVDAKLTFFKKTLFDGKVIEKDFPDVARCHYSLDYSEFAWTDCPHIAYRVTVSVTGQGGGAAAGVAVQGTGLDSDPVTGSDGTAVFYLPNGSYSLSCSDGKVSGTASLTVSDAAGTASIALGAGSGIVASGECGADGDNITWQLDKDWLLTISGSGDMKDYDHENNRAPWYKDYQYHIKKIQMEGDITSIGDYAFADCAKVTEVVISDSVTSIGGAAFYSCLRLEEAAIPDSVTSIGNAAFYNCFLLTGITIPDHVTLLGESAFAQCSKLSEITIPGSIATARISNSVFRGCTGLKKVTIQEGIDIIGGSAFEDCSNLTEVLLPASVVKIEGFAFNGCPISDVYYAGSESYWALIYIEMYNYILNDASIHYNVTDVSGMKTGASFLRRAASGKKAAKFTGLEPDTAYVFLAVKMSDASDILAADNLLYIAQDTADGEGELTFLYEPRTGDSAKLCVCGLASYKEMSDSEAQDVEQSGSPEPSGTPTVNGTLPPETGEPGSTPSVNVTQPPVTRRPGSTPSVNVTQPPETGKPEGTPSVNVTQPPVTGEPESTPSVNGTQSPETEKPGSTPSVNRTQPPVTERPDSTPSMNVTQPPVTGKPGSTPSVNRTQPPAAGDPGSTPSVNGTQPPVMGNPGSTPSVSGTQPSVTGKPESTPSVGKQPSKVPTASEKEESDTDLQKRAFQRKTVKIKKVKSPKKRMMKVTWAKLSGADRYQMQYSRKRSMKKAKKRTTFRTDVTLTGLKRRKYYYVRVRAYKYINGSKVYSRWSGKRSVRIK